MFTAVAAALLAYDGDRLTLMTYNVQNLFDARHDGGEYADFTPQAGWDQDRYHERLIRLGGILTRHDPDIVALQEIEGERVISDLLRDYVRTPYTVVVPRRGAGNTRVVLLSRLPVRRARVHRSAEITVGEGRDPVLAWQSRDMIDATIDVQSGVLRVFVCHWKSQSGGERITEPQRIQSAALISGLVRSRNGNGEVAVVVVGDLNEDVAEFEQHDGQYLTALMPAGELPSLTEADRRRVIGLCRDVSDVRTTSREVVAYSPWFSANPGSPGTYYYSGRWERLDHLLLISAGAAPSSLPDCVMQVVTGPDLTDSNGRPRRYDPRTGTGVSDHLPVLFTVEFSQTPS